MKKVVIIGGGPAGLMAAYQLSQNKLFQIKIIDANKAIARKFLVAGHGGFNLTNSEKIDSFIKKYNHNIIKGAVLQFTNEDTIQWLLDLGIETFKGSSGKIFPIKSIKPIQVLNALVDKLLANNVEIVTSTRLVDFDKNVVTLENGRVTFQYNFDYLIFAMGGASWKKTGSTGEWVSLFQKKKHKYIAF